MYKEENQSWKIDFIIVQIIYFSSSINFDIMKFIKNEIIYIKNLLSKN